MNNCTFNPEDHQAQPNGTLVKCPECGHYVILGNPHPDFSNRALPIPLDELTRLALKQN